MKFTDDAFLPAHPVANAHGYQISMSCDVLGPTLDFFHDVLGFRIDAIFPADNPSTAIISSRGLSIRLGVSTKVGVQELHILCGDPCQFADGARECVAPNGVRIRLIAADPPMRLPATRQSLVLTRVGDQAQWHVGRAGLRYRDLIPERHGGAFIASHIRILDGGPVPDYVHFHKVRFQSIFCRRGWVRVVYEGQGEPFELHAGDCVLQPPTIRHRVLASSAGAEVVEVSSPAEHVTMVDHEMSLPTPAQHPVRDFEGQQFVRHIAAEAIWRPWRIAGFEVSDTGIGAATRGLAGVRVVRHSGATGERTQAHNTEFCFYFVLAGTFDVVQGIQRYSLAADDSITLPANVGYAFESCSPDLHLLEVTLPADFAIAS